MQDPTENELEQMLRNGVKAEENGDLVEMQRIYSDGLHLAEQAGNTEYIAHFLRNLALYHGNRGAVESALECLDRAYTLFEKLGHYNGMARCLANRGFLSKDLNERIRYLEESAGYFEKANNYRGVGTMMVGIAVVYEEMVRSGEMFDYYCKAVAAYKQADEAVKAGNILLILAGTYPVDSRLEEINDCLQEALTLYQSVGATERVALAYRVMGSIYESQDEHGKALEYYHRSWELFEAVNELGERVTFLIEVGDIYKNLGSYGKALEYFKDALNYSEAAEDEEGIVKSLTHLGNTYSAQKQYEQAMTYYQTAAESCRKRGLENQYAEKLTNVASCLKFLQRYGEALELLEKAQDVSSRLNDDYQTSLTLMGMASLYYQQGQYESAVVFYQRAAILFEQETAVKSFQALNLYGMSMAEALLNRLDDAVIHCDQALVIQEAVGDYSSIPNTLMNRGILCQMQRQWEEADAYFQRAIDAFEEMGLQVGDPSHLGEFQDAHIRNIYNFYASHLEFRGHLEEALAMVERGRGQGLARQIAQNHVDLYQLLAHEDASRLDHYLKVLVSARRERKSAPIEESIFADQAERMRLNKHVNERYLKADRQLSIFRADLNQRYPDFRRLRGAEPPSFDALFAIAKQNPDTLYLEWAIVDKDRSLLFALSAEGIRSFMLRFGQRELGDSIDKWRYTLEARGMKQRSLQKAALELASYEPKMAKLLFRKLFAPLEEYGILDAQCYSRLVIAPDGPMLGLPFAALMDASGKRLIDRFAISISVSLGMLRWQSNTRQAEHPFLCVADPNDGQPIALRGNQFAAFQQAKSQSRNLDALIPGMKLMVGQEAFKAAVIEEMPRYAILHFITHGLLDAENALRSGLLLAQKEGDTEDGFLEAQDIMNMSLSAEMAVLSACQSGLGRVSGGEGLLGLAWAFRAAGCPSIVASLWSVEDAATGELMVEFYKGLKQGRRKDEALRAAMQSLRCYDEDRGTSNGLHSYFWSGFQIIGNADPIQLFTKAGTM